MTSHNLKDIVSNLEKKLIVQKTVLQKFPDAKVNAYWTNIPQFTSKTVNKEYTQFSFVRRYNGLYVVPYYEIPITFDDGHTTYIRVYSRPRASRLAYIPWGMKDGKKTIKFSRFAFNMKSNSLVKDEILEECRAEVMSFISDNPGCNLDTKHLEPRLKKLLAFV